MNQRQIKFRAWDKKHKIMWDGKTDDFWIGSNGGIKVGETYQFNLILMQFTGLKDKNGLTDIFEGDIIDREGNVIGNQYENSNLLQEKTNLLIQEFGTKDWCSTYKEAMERGCKNSE